MNAGVPGGERRSGPDVQLELVSAKPQPVVVCGGVWVKECSLALLEDFGAGAEDFGEHVLNWLAKFGVCGSSVFPQG